MDLKLHLTDKSQQIFELLKLLFLILYIAHICGCLWHFISDWELSKGKIDVWIYIHGLAEEPWIIKYINALYYSVLTMITVGHITTDSPTEKSFSIIIVLVLSGIFAYSINTIGNILYEMRKNTQDLKFNIKIYT